MKRPLRPQIRQRSHETGGFRERRPAAPDWLQLLRADPDVPHPDDAGETIEREP